MVRLTVSAGFTTGAVEGTCASTGRASVSTAAVMPTKIAADMRLRWDMLASAIRTQDNAYGSARFPARQTKGATAAAPLPDRVPSDAQ